MGRRRRDPMVAAGGHPTRDPKPAKVAHHLSCPTKAAKSGLFSERPTTFLQKKVFSPRAHQNC